MFDIRDHGGIFGEGNNSIYNIFNSVAEPLVKKGLWIKNGNKVSKIQTVDGYLKGSKVETITKSPYQQSFSIADVDGDFFYLSTFNSSVRKTVKFDMLTQIMIDMPSPFTVTMPAIRVIDDYLYGIGNPTNQSGNNGQYMARINKVTGLLESLATIPIKAIYCAIVVVDKYIYILGGGDNSSYINRTTYRYDTSNNTWTQLASLPDSRVFVSGFHYNGKIYLLGGTNNYNSRLDVHVYDILSNTWSVSNNVLPANATSPPVHVIGDYMYINGVTIGGIYTTLHAVDLRGNSWVWNSIGKFENNNAFGCMLPYKGAMYNLYNANKYDGIKLEDPSVEPNALVFISDDGTKFETELIDMEKTFEVINNQLKFPIYKAFETTLDGKLNKSKKVYYGNGNSWLPMW